MYFSQTRDAKRTATAADFGFKRLESLCRGSLRGQSPREQSPRALPGQLRSDCPVSLGQMLALVFLRPGSLGDKPIVCTPRTQPPVCSLCPGSAASSLGPPCGHGCTLVSPPVLISNQLKDGGWAFPSPAPHHHLLVIRPHPNHHYGRPLPTWDLLLTGL